MGPMTSRIPPGLPFMMPGPYFFHVYLPLLPSRNPQLRPPLCPLSKPQNCLLVSLCSKSPSTHPISCSFCIFLEILQSFKTQFKSQLLQEAFSSLPGIISIWCGAGQWDQNASHLIPEHVTQALCSEMHALVLYTLCPCTSYTCFHIPSLTLKSSPWGKNQQCGHPTDVETKA